MERGEEVTFRLRCCNDFVFFCENVLKLEMTDFHKEIAHLLVNERYVCMNVPRQHGKTTLCSIAYPLWIMSKEKDIEICLVSSSMDQSTKIFADAQYILETNPYFKELLPTRRKETWNRTQITTSNHNLYFVKSFTSSGRGMKANYILYDDILREEGVSPEQAKELFWSVFYPAGQANNCQQILIGTPLSLDDLYADIKRKKSWAYHKKDSVIEDTSGNWIGSLWASRFPVEKLKQMLRDMGSYKFEREMRCRPKATGESLFPPEMVLNCMDYDLELSTEVKGTAFSGNDYAMSTKESGDYNVFIVVDDVPNSVHTKKTDKGEVKINSPIFIRHITRFRGSVGQTETAIRLQKLYKKAKIIADNSGVGAKFVKELQDNSCYVVAQDFQPAKRNMLLMNLRTLIEQNRLVIPGGDESAPLVNILLRELSGFRSVRNPNTGHESWKSGLSHDDSTMALALAVKDVSNPRTASQDILFLA